MPMTTSEHGKVSCISTNQISIPSRTSRKIFVLSEVNNVIFDPLILMITHNPAEEQELERLIDGISVEED